MTHAVSDQELAAVVDRLPPVSIVMQRLLDVLQDPDSDVADIARLVRVDTALATQVLRLANSAHYGLAERVASVEEAVQHIGMNETHRLITVLCSRRLFARSLDRYVITEQLLWEHSIAVAVASEIIAREVAGDESVAYLCGILHTIGIVALDGVATARKLDPRTSELPLLDWEREQFGTDNAGAAARVLRYWRFPDTLSAALGARYAQPTPETLKEPASVLFVACCMAEKIAAGLPPEGGIFRLPAPFFSDKTITVERFEELQIETLQKVARTRTLLRLA